MESDSLTIVKRLAVEREMPLRDIATLLPKKTNDHRDYYVLASLITGGFIDVWLEKSINKETEQEIALKLYVWVRGGGKDFEYRGMRSSGGDFGTVPFFATAKGYLALDELRAKRTERIWALSIAIGTALIASALGGLAG